METICLAPAHACKGDIFVIMLCAHIYKYMVEYRSKQFSMDFNHLMFVFAAWIKLLCPWRMFSIVTQAILFFFFLVNRILIRSKLFYIYRSLILSEFWKLKFWRVLVIKVCFFKV